MTIQQIEKELIILPTDEKLRLARWLLDTVLESKSQGDIEDKNPLLRVAGLFSGGPGDTAERAEEILADEVNSVYGLGIR